MNKYLILIMSGLFVACGGGVSSDSLTSCALNRDDCPKGSYCEFTDFSCGVGQGECRKIPEICPELYAPVCGCNGQTYGNTCEAQGASQSLISDGECK